MRRRLWWFIVSSDIAITATSGVGTPVLPRNWDARLPLNINDDDISPEMTEEPTSRPGFTEMTFSITQYEVASILLVQGKKSRSTDAVVSGEDSSAPVNASPRFLSLDVILEVLQEAEQKLTPLTLRFPDPETNSLHCLALQNRITALKTLHLATEPMEEAPEWGTEVFGPEDNLFRVNLVATEALMDMRERVGPDSVWFTNIDLDVQAFCFLVAQLQTRVTGSMADRAWAVVGRMYTHHEELWDLVEKDKMTLANLLLVAWQSRAEHFAAKRIVLPEPPFLERLRNEVIMIKAQAISLL